MKKISIIFLLTMVSVAFGQRVENGKLVDKDGKTLILHGINHVVKDSTINFFDEKDESIFKLFKECGFNVVRFGVNWSGLEPTPGVYDEAYLAKLDKRVEWARENGLYLMLDMHQDLYAQQWADGAPAWAVITDGLPHTKGNVWSDAYSQSQALQRAVDHFWKDTPASDGVGIKTHFLNCLKVLAKRYKNAESVIGFDILNEPFQGSSSKEVVPYMMHAYATAKGIDLQQVAADREKPDWLDQFLGDLADPKIYQAVVDAAQPIVDKFEMGVLSDFYQDARDVVRAEGCDKILFLEHNYFCNMGIKSNFKIPVDKNGKPDTQIMYAPHAYDLVTDRDNNDEVDNRRFEFILNQIEKSAKERNLPVVVGEWGAFYSGDKAFEAPAKYAMQQFQKRGWGQTIWAYWGGIENHSYFKKYLCK